ncbi:MAG TPA: pitrilysin family protein [Thermoanaerobaculia bacterium]|nr:pitrilysin family protein [Thermoanaerobaculia bacterium]
MRRRPAARALAWMLASILVAATALAQAPASPDRSHPPAPGPPPPLRLPPIQRLKLSNGVPVILVERHKVPLVDALVVFRGGASADPQNRPGLANLTASLLERGAGSRSALEISDIADYLGANLSAGAGWDSTTVGINVPSARLEPGLALLSDLVLNPTFPAPEVERVRSELLTEILQWRDDPEQLASVAFSKAVFAGHPYSRDIQGNAVSVQAVTREEIRRFHAERYVPGSAAIVVTGDAVPATLVPLLEASFGKWKPSTAGAAPSVGQARQIAKRRVILVDKPDAPQSQILIGRVGPARSTPDFFPLVVTNTILGGSFTSRLNHNLRETKGYTYGASSQFDFRLSTGPFVAGAAVQTDKTGPALTEFFKELDAIRSDVPADELARAKNYTARRFPAAFETAGQLAGRVRDQFVYGLPDDYFATYVSRIEAVTPADVQRVARAWIDPAAMVVVIVGDRKKIEAEVRALRLGPVEVQSIDDVLGRAPGRGR